MTSSPISADNGAQSGVALSMSDAGSETDLTLRAENLADAEWIALLQARSFGPGRFARTAFRVRERIEVDASLGLIAEHKGERVGAVSMTPISLSGENGYLLGPLATLPEFRNKGAGRLLVRQASVQALQRPGVRFVVLIGDRTYYEALGFSPSSPGAIVFPGPVDPHRVLVHCADLTHVDQFKGTIEPRA